MSVCCRVVLLVLPPTTSLLQLFKQPRCMIQRKHTTHLWQQWPRHRVLLSIRCRSMPRRCTKLQSTHRSMTQRRRITTLWQRQRHHLLPQLRCTQQCQPIQSIKHVCSLALTYSILIEVRIITVFSDVHIYAAFPYGVATSDPLPSGHVIGD